MRITLTAFTIILATSIIAFPAHCAPKEAAANSQPEVDEVIASCNNDWSDFDKALNRFHDKVKPELRNLSAADLTKRLDNEDPLLVLVSLLWPSDLSEKYLSWNAFKECSQRNFQVRKILTDSGSSLAARNKEIELLDSCFHVVYYRDHVPKPLDRLLACYSKQAGNKPAATSGAAPTKTKGAAH